MEVRAGVYLCACARLRAWCCEASPDGYGGQGWGACEGRWVDARAWFCVAFTVGVELAQLQDNRKTTSLS
eukprot:scaffold262418_cov21-Tisochrysis_lutea.AAC.1